MHRLLTTHEYKWAAHCDLARGVMPRLSRELALPDNEWCLSVQQEPHTFRWMVSMHTHPTFNVSIVVADTFTVETLKDSGTLPESNSKICVWLSLRHNHECGTLSGGRWIWIRGQNKSSGVGEAGTTPKQYLYFEFYQSLWQHIGLLMAHY